MVKRALLLLMAVAAVVGVQRTCEERAVSVRPGIVVRAAPAQTALTRAQAQPFEHEGYRIEPRAAYELSARLLARKAYHLGREAALSPLDFALGWGPMSDGSVLDALEISQSGRFFWVRWSAEPPIPSQHIFVNAANTHLIPADKTVRRALDRMRPGHVVHLRGYLVDVSAPDGWRWKTSLVRDDTGAGACELFWVTDAWIDNEHKT